MKRWLLLMAGCAASGGCLYWLLRTVDLTATGAALRTAGIGMWSAAAGIYLVGFVPRAFRWRLMLASTGRFPLAEIWRCIVFGYTANNLLPFRLGEVVRAVMFSRLTGLSKTTSLASIAAERLFDGFVLAILLVVILWTSPYQETIPASFAPVLLGAKLLAGAGLVILLIGIFATDPAVALATRLSPRLGNLAAKSVASLAFVRRPYVFSAVAALSVLVWAIEGSMFVVIAAAMDVPSPVLAGFFTLAVVNLGILIPAAPGYVGIFQAAAVLAFTAMHRPASEGLAFGVLVHAAQFIPLTLLGLLVAVPYWGTLAVIARPLTTKADHV